MSRFLLIRHASHDYLDRAIASWLPGVHLNDKGMGEVERLAAALADSGIQALYSSPLERTMETASAISRRLNHPVQIRECFGEMRFGDWTDKTFEALNKDPRWHTFNRFRAGTRAPGGELMLEVQGRMVAGMEAIREELPEATVAIVSHGDPIKAAVMYYTGMSLDHLARIEISPASVSVLDVRDRGPKLLLLNGLPGQSAWSVG